MRARRALGFIQVNYSVGRFLLSILRFEELIYLVCKHGDKQVVFVAGHLYELVGIDFPPRRIVFDFDIFQSARLPVDFLLQEKKQPLIFHLYVFGAVIQVSRRGFLRKPFDVQFVIYEI